MSLPATPIVEFLVTGTARSGTLWAARMFTELGVTCMHEHAYGQPQRHIPYVGEASWLAAPHAAGLAAAGAPIIVMQRDPVDVVRSVFRERQMVRGDFYTDYSLEYCPIAGETDDHMARAIRYVAHWLDALSLTEAQYCRLRTGDPDSFVDAFNWVTGTLIPVARVEAAMASVGVVNRDPGPAAWRERETGRRPSRDEVLTHAEAWRLRSSCVTSDVVPDTRPAEESS